MADLSKEGYDIHMTSVYMSISKPGRNNDAQLSQETTTFQCVRIHQDFSQGVHMLPPHMPSRHFIGSKAGLAALSVLLNNTPYPDSNPGPKCEPSPGVGVRVRIELEYGLGLARHCEAIQHATLDIGDDAEIVEDSTRGGRERQQKH